MLNNVYKILYPTGAAFKTLQGSFRSKVHDGVDYALSDFFDIKDSFFNGLYPDNDLITIKEIDFLSYIYGLEYPSGTTFSQKKQLLLNRMNRSGAANYKQSAIYMQKVLNDFGFDVMVTENTSGNIPVELMTVNFIQHGINVQHGMGMQLGMKHLPVIANSQELREVYSLGANNNWAAFFITGIGGLDQYIPVQDSRMREFRELVLRLKPAHTVAVLKVANDDTLGAEFNNDFNNDYNIID